MTSTNTREGAAGMSGAQQSRFDGIVVTEDGEVKATVPSPPPTLPQYSMRFPHKQKRRGDAIRRLYDRHLIDDARAVALLKPTSKWRDRCWAVPFNPLAVVEIWRSMRPRHAAAVSRHG